MPGILNLDPVRGLEFLYFFGLPSESGFRPDNPRPRWVRAEARTHLTS